MIDYSRKITPICCHAYRVNRLWEEAENRWVIRLTIEPQTFCGLKEIDLRPMKLDYQFLAQIFENLMRAGGYYSLFNIFQKYNTHPKHENFCQKNSEIYIGYS